MLACWVYFLFHKKCCPVFVHESAIHVSILRTTSSSNASRLIMVQIPWDFIYCFTWCTRITALLYRPRSVLIYNTIFLFLYWASLKSQIVITHLSVPGLVIGVKPYSPSVKSSPLFKLQGRQIEKRRGGLFFVIGSFLFYILWFHTLIFVTLCIITPRSEFRVLLVWMFF